VQPLRDEVAHLALALPHTVAGQQPRVQQLLTAMKTRRALSRSG
jgi:hypothetical protein